MMARGPLDSLVAAPTFQILDKGARPEVESFFGRLMQLGHGSDRAFTISEDGHRRLWPGRPVERTARIVYGHADNPESLAAMRAGCAWLDEAGQKRFRQGSYEEVNRRVSFDRGRVLLTTTAYNLGWLKQLVHDRWAEANQNHAEIDVINFRSIDNPAFPREEYDRAFRDLPLWKALMFYDGKFTRPAGLIYGVFDPRRHKVPRYRLPDEWPRSAGLDFGATNTASVFFAEKLSPSTKQPTGHYVAYREYRPGKLPPETHAAKLLEGEPAVPVFVGGSRSEGEWRQKFREATLPVLEPPVSSVEVQIDSLHSLVANGRLEVMEDLVGLLDELGSYSRVLDEAGEPTEEIDGDQFYHYLACARYWASWAARRSGDLRPTDRPDNRLMTADAPPGVFEAKPTSREASHGRYDDERGGRPATFPEW